MSSSIKLSLRLVLVIICTFSDFYLPTRAQSNEVKRQTIVTGHEAIPTDTVRNVDFRVDGTGSPIYQYKRGHSGRIEFLEAIIKPNNLGRGSPCSTAARAFTTRMSGGIRNDICGHIVANVLGGPGNEEFNLFPQNSRLNNGNWKSFERRVKLHLQSGGNNAANLRFWFDYSNARSTRPTAFTVVANLLRGDQILEQPAAFRVLNQANQ